MPTKGNQNTPNNQNDNPDVDVKDSANDGDILEQLKAESASSSNIYKLELKMFKTITNMDKTMTKEYKLFMQGKKNLDSMNTALTNISRDSSSIRTTLSTVDNSLRHILAAIERIQESGLPHSTAADSSRQNQSTLEFSTYQDRIQEDTRRLADLQAERNAGEISDAEYEQQSADLTESIRALNQEMHDAQKILGQIFNRYEEVVSFEDRIDKSIQSVLDQYQTHAIDKDEFQKRLEDLKKVFDEHNEALKQAELDWKEDGKVSLSKYLLDQNGLPTREEALADFDKRKEDLTRRFENFIPDENGHVMTNEEFSQSMLDLAGERNSVLSSIDSMTKVGSQLDGLVNKIASGKTYDAKTGMNTTASATVEAASAIAGELAGSEVGAAIGNAIGGPVGEVVGEVAGGIVGSKIEALGSLIGDRLDYLANHSKKTRDEILRAGLDKIRSDVKDMATYSIEIYEDATKNIYAAWDKNLGQITATQGYTKEALNSLQDSVAQRLQEEGYGTTIDASQYLDQLANTLNANLGGTLAEAFAAQNLILQKAVPEVDLSASAAEFAAIYASANRQGTSGEDTMISAMNEIAGAAKALEDVTEGNNQFLKETSTLLNRAMEVVNIAGGNADQIAGLTTQMMASEAAITSVAPQLSGFTSELVNILMNNNDATAVSLRAIMNDINSNIGVSATSFMKSFMDDTQGTLSTAFAAIQRFIDKNENEASRQEFLHAMESVFGVNGSKLAQIDFGGVSELIDQVNTSINMAALTDAENLVRSGETTSLEEQLVANTSNQLLATNAISATIDNKLMRKLETNELSMEKLVYSIQATQSVDLAENTLNFFTRLFDLVTSIFDPFGLFDSISTSINATTSALIDSERYLITASMSNIGSTVADNMAGATNTIANTVGGATAVMMAAQTKSTDAMAAAVERSGVSPSFEHMLTDYAQASKEAQAIAAENQAESNAISYSAIEQQARQSSEYRSKQDEALEQEAKYEEEKSAAREQQRAMQEAEDIRNLENHDNIVIIKDALDNLDFSEYLQPILEEHRTHTEQIKDLQSQTKELVNLVSTIIEYSLVTSPEFASTISFDERARIMDNGYVSTASVPFV